MIKIFKVYICSFFALMLLSCSIKTNNVNETNLKIGVTSVPHGEILQNLKNIFNLDFEIINYVDYNQLNKDLVDEKIDANFFQTREYLENFNLNSDTKLVELTEVHVEPLIVYSSKYKDISKVDPESLVYIPNNSVNRDRALKLLEKANLIKISFDVNKKQNIITENDKNLIINEIEESLIPSFYNDGDLLIMNTNTALENSIMPHISGIFYEESFSDKSKANVFVTRENMRTSIELKQIANLLNSYETFKFINQKYKGFVKPIF